MIAFLFCFATSFQSLLWATPTYEWTTPTTHDFGDLQLLKPATYDFKFKNTGDAPIVIDNVRSVCGCTATEWSETPVLPGKEGYVRVVFDARKAGYFNKKVTVFF
ncbi:MAG: DUF1573 domain-containing protein, partial [Saprospiraceae bacterium]|nr:DUF1573 domain-containing protein [Saprospiraceae bacterium]